MKSAKLSTKNYIAIADWQLKLGLNTRELLLYALIYGFTQDKSKNGFYGNLEYVAAWLGLGEKNSRNSLRYLQSLVKKKLITKQDLKTDEHYKVCIYKTIADNGPIIENPNIEYIIIQPWMINELKLNGKDLLLYALINGFSRGENTCLYKPKFYAKWAQCQDNHIPRQIKKLLDKKLIKKVDNGYISLYSQSDSHKTIISQNDSHISQTENNMSQSDSPKLRDNNISSNNLNNINNNIKDLDLSLPIFDTKERRKQYKQLLKQISSLNCSRESMIKFWNKIAENDFKDPEGKPIKNMAGYMVSILSKNPHLKNRGVTKLPDYDKLAIKYNPKLLTEARKQIKRRKKEKPKASPNDNNSNWWPF